MLFGAYREFERRTGELTERRGAKREMIVTVIERLPPHFQVSDIERACPGVSRPTINRALRDLREAGRILCVKGGRDAMWEKRDHDPVNDIIYG